MDVLFHHTCRITCTSSTPCHKFYHPCLSCWVRLSPDLVYWYIPVQTMILWMHAFLVHLYCCICPSYVESEDRNWVIGCFRWWSFSVDPPSISCAIWHYVLIARKEGSALRSLCARLLAALPCMSRNPMNVPLVPHIPEVIYVVGLLQWTHRHQPLCWSAHTTVGWPWWNV